MKHRAIWVGHREHGRSVMAFSLKANNYSGSGHDAERAGQGLEAWEWVEKKWAVNLLYEAVDVALYSIQGLPNTCKKKA